MYFVRKVCSYCEISSRVKTLSTLAGAFLTKGDNSFNVWGFLSYCYASRWSIKVLTDIPKHLNSKF